MPTACFSCSSPRTIARGRRLVEQPAPGFAWPTFDHFCSVFRGSFQNVRHPGGASSMPSFVCPASRDLAATCIKKGKLHATRPVVRLYAWLLDAQLAGAD